jgi:hypothetical protein
MPIGLSVLLAGLVLAYLGHRSGRLQLRAIGAGIAAFGFISLVLPSVFG